jgi:hypothetical protein
LPIKLWNDTLIKMLLQRYLPTGSNYRLEKWLANHSDTTGIIIDPFGTSPFLLIELARRGETVLVAANNPINKFLIEVGANPPSKDDLYKCLSSLAATRRGKERLEPHILSLYETICDDCHQVVSAKYFVWEKGNVYPTSKWVACPKCNFEGLSDITEVDKNILEQFKNDGLHRARALESIISKDDKMRGDVEEAVGIYSPRTLYALFTILNKFEILSLPENQKQALQVILLHTFDASSNLWSHSNSTYRPLQLKVPNRYIEFNVWHSLEEGLKLIQHAEEKIEVTVYPIFPKENGLCIYPGPIRDLATVSTEVDVKGIVSSVPYPNMAFWKLSALWSGWLFGRESIARFVTIIKRKRFNWHWHATALSETLESLKNIVKDKTPFYFSLSPIREGFIFALFFALHNAKYLVKTSMYSMSPKNLILEGEKGIDKKVPSSKPENKSILEIAKSILDSHDQPLSFLSLLPNILKKFPIEESSTSDEVTSQNKFSEYINPVKSVFKYRNGFLQFGGTGNDISTGVWGLEQSENYQESQDDIIEKWLIRTLLKNQEMTTADFVTAMWYEFPQNIDLSEEYLGLLLNSYASLSTNSIWWIKANELPVERSNDIYNLQNNLVQIAQNGGFGSRGKTPIVWEGINFEKQFFLGASAAISSKVYAQQENYSEKYIGIPGSRADLFLYKLKRNPYLENLLSNNWKVVKFRTIQQMHSMGKISLTQFDEIIMADQLENNDPQLRLI